MTATLVDHSTLTAVQRLIGAIPVARSFPIEGDVVAYDQYLQALLIYDDVAAIDDYKAEHRGARVRAFPEVHFVHKENVPYDFCVNTALQGSSELFFQINQGRLGHDPMAEFLRSLDLHVAPAWYMQSSDWFLRLRILAAQTDIDLPKYGALVSAIKGQLYESSLTSQSWPHKFRIEDRDGKEVNQSAGGDGSIDPEIDRFASGLNWIAQRSSFYIGLAQELKCSVTLHPIRHAFIGRYAVDCLMPDLSRDMRTNILAFFDSQMDDIKRKSDDFLGQGSCRLELPFFSAWAIGHAGNPKDGHDHVLQIRDGVEARNLRSRLREIEEIDTAASFKGKRLAIAKLYAAIQQDAKHLRGKFGGAPESPKLDVGIDMLSLTPSLSIADVLEPIARRLPTKTRRATALLRSIGRDVMELPTLGDIADMFMKSRRIRKGTGFNPERPRVEDRRYERATTHFRRPL